MIEEVTYTDESADVMVVEDTCADRVINLDPNTIVVDEPIAAAPVGDAAAASNVGKTLGFMFDVFDVDPVAWHESDSNSHDGVDDLGAELHDVLALEDSGLDVEDVAAVVDTLLENEEMHAAEEAHSDRGESSVEDERRPVAPLEGLEIRNTFWDETYEEYALAIGLHPAWGWSSLDGPNGSVLGNIRILPTGTSMKATCRMHASCTLFTNLVQGDFNLTTKMLVAWLGASRSSSVRDAAGHKLAARMCLAA